MTQPTTCPTRANDVTGCIGGGCASPYQRATALSLSFSPHRSPTPRGQTTHVRAPHHSYPVTVATVASGHHVPINIQWVNARKTARDQRGQWKYWKKVHTGVEKHRHMKDKTRRKADTTTPFPAKPNQTLRLCCDNKLHCTTLTHTRTHKGARAKLGSKERESTKPLSPSISLSSRVHTVKIGLCNEMK